MYKYGNSRVIFIASLLMSCLMPAASVQAQTKTSVTQNLPKTAPSTVTPILSFASPAAGAVSTDGNMTVTLHLDGNADPSTLKVMLNGTDVTSWFSTSSCASAPCNIHAQGHHGQCRHCQGTLLLRKWRFKLHKCYCDGPCRERCEQQCFCSSGGYHSGRFNSTHRSAPCSNGFDGSYGRANHRQHKLPSLQQWHPLQLLQVRSDVLAGSRSGVSYRGRTPEPDRRS